jgi:hypothetical protein
MLFVHASNCISFIIKVGAVNTKIFQGNKTHYQTLAAYHYKNNKTLTASIKN